MVLAQQRAMLHIMPVIRPAQPHDLDAVLRLATQFATSFVVNEQLFHTVFAAVLHTPDALLAVAEVDGQIVGYVLAFRHVTFFANGPVAWVEELMVAPDQRQHGLGRLLTQDVEAWATAHSCRLVALATRRAADFYQAIGYHESATYFRKLL